MLGLRQEVVQPMDSANGLEGLAYSATLPMFTLVGPLELVLPRPQVVDLQLPHRWVSVYNFPLSSGGRKIVS
jgi:hypothetical protein